VWYGVVYRITNLENGKCYIGRTKRALHKRWYDHCHQSSFCLYLKNAIQKYGKENFSIVEIASSWDVESLKELEMLLIRQEKTLVPNGYNLINTSCGAGEVSEETRTKLSKVGKGRLHTDESKQKMSEARQGIVFSEEHRQSLSAAKKGRPSQMKGKRFSEEARANMGGQNKGKTASDETKAKMSSVRKEMKWFTDGITDCRIRDGDLIPENFRRGRTKGLNNLPNLIDSWKDPAYRQYMSDIHRRSSNAV
jgi:group I intron endonuclease